MSDLLAEALHKIVTADLGEAACDHHADEYGVSIECEDRAAALRASSDRLAIAASLLTEDEMPFLRRASDGYHDYWHSGAPINECPEPICKFLAALRGESR